MSAKGASLDLRVTPRQKDLIRRAAAVRGQSMSEFVLETVEPVAAALVEQQEHIVLSEIAWTEFVRMVTEPAAPTELAKREAAEFLAKRIPTVRSEWP